MQTDQRETGPRPNLAIDGFACRQRKRYLARVSAEGSCIIDPVAREACDIVLAALRPHSVSVFVFGSRARADAGVRSDIDLAVLAPEGLPRGALAIARAALEESTIPQRVDLIDLAVADADLLQRVQREGILCNG